MTPLFQHHVRRDDELDAGDILDGEIVAEADDADDQADEEAQEPFHKRVLEYLCLAPAPPVLLEQLVLENPAIHTTTT